MLLAIKISVFVIIAGFHQFKVISMNTVRNHEDRQTVIITVFFYYTFPASQSELSNDFIFWDNLTRLSTAVTFSNLPQQDQDALPLSVR